MVSGAPRTLGREGHLGVLREALRVHEATFLVAVKAAESSARGRSMCAYDASGSVARVYARLAREVGGGAP